MSNRLPILQNEIVGLHNAVGRHEKSAAVKALAAGAALAEAKSLCRHGEWAAWLKKTGIPERSAQRYMKLHRSGLKSATVADLGLSFAEKVAGNFEKLWPDDGGGRFVTGEGRGRFFWAVTLRDGDLAFYAAIHGNVVNTGAQSVCFFKPLSAEFLANLHFEEVGPIPIQDVQKLSGAEAEKRLNCMGAKLVRNAWGTRLEATFRGAAA